MRIPTIHAADALTVRPRTFRPPSFTARPARDRPQARWFRSSSSSSSSVLTAVVVPELDDSSHPEDYDDNNNNSDTGDGNSDARRSSPELLGGDDYVPGVEEFRLEDAVGERDPWTAETERDDENLVFDNPFSFPMPTVAYTETGTRDVPPRPTPPPPPTTGRLVADTDDGDKDAPENTIGGMGPTAFRAAPTSSIGGGGFAESVVKDGTNNTGAGTRTMTTPAAKDNDDDDDASDTDMSKFAPTRDAKEDKTGAPAPAPATTSLRQEQKVDDERDSEPSQVDLENDFAATPFAPFASILDENSGPIQPLVAPLKLSPDPAARTKKNEAGAADATRSSAAVPSIETNGLDDLVDSLEGQLASVEREIETMAPPSSDTASETKKKKKKKINLNSHKQVSQLLFGRPDLSTNKETLEGMAGSNVLARLVLDYRDVSRRLKKARNQQQSRGISETTRPTENPRRVPKNPILLFDTSSFIFRAYYSNPPIHRGKDGMPIGAVMGFCSMLNKLLLSSMLRGETPTVVHCLDAPGPTFRNHLYEEYKAQRPPVPLDLVPQFDLIHRAIRAYGMVQIQATGYEADDVIASLATMASQSEGRDVTILSGDKDLMQLITDDAEEEEEDGDATADETGIVQMFDPMTSKVWNHDTVVEKWGVRADRLGDVLALAGDAADNVPGVPGIGPKIAAKLLQEFGSLERLLENTHDIPQPKRRASLEDHADLAKLSRTLVELDRSLDWSDLQVFRPPSPGDDDDDGSVRPPTILPDSTPMGDLAVQPFDADRVLAFYDEMGFRKLKTQLLHRLDKEPPPSRGRRDGTTVPESAASSQSATKPKTKRKRNTSWKKKITRGVPMPEDWEGVPF